jgi:glycosyltransferase involved in cell wall biosynthesis
VVYPPITGDWYNDEDEGYFVTWSRLAPEKRIGLIAEAFTELDERLVIAGDGEERARLDGIARDHENIEVRGFIDDIQALVANATAVVYAPVQEDFGLVGAEALTAGKPLLGVNEGFTKSQVEEGVTGHAFDPTVESIRNVVETFEPDAFDTETIQTAAQKYSYDKFRQGLRQSIVTAHRQGRDTQI